ncbi:hypothetical protein GZ77_20565 [Endozoicomonas montiporae]|uniref:IrrE N-terminal-like domain-containing protein n=2 Tax=Endozoicomonas montiporae TaxID=1027273 RepID=A0A081N318_9GAMM|nr:ImmA/IrrE family metallo-endopeptidase [Endozoicomonas montiporae]KEQ12841.1 hypothetical protein GZ77_20565 [Endozoicomonas montiporae]
MIATVISSPIDIVRVLEHFLVTNYGVEYEYPPKDEMSQEGLTRPDDRSIKIRLDVYEAACKGDPRGRFTIAHEIGHLLLHQGVTPEFARDGNQAHQIFEDSEWQADEFAGALLIPSSAVESCDNPEELCEKYGVSIEAAETRYRNHVKRKQKRLQVRP